MIAKLLKLFPKFPGLSRFYLCSSFSCHVQVHSLPTWHVFRAVRSMSLYKKRRDNTVPGFPPWAEASCPRPFQDRINIVYCWFVPVCQTGSPNTFGLGNCTLPQRAGLWSGEMGATSPRWWTFQGPRPFCWKQREDERGKERADSDARMAWGMAKVGAPQHWQLESSHRPWLFGCFSRDE